MSSSTSILVDNSKSVISGMPRSDLASLRKAFSYIDKEASYFSPWPKIRYAIDRYGTFGTGLLEEVLEYLKEKNIFPDVQDSRVIPKTNTAKLRIKKSLPTPYKEQSSIVESLLLHHIGIGILPTGTGKSLVSALAIDALRVNTVIITPNLNLKIQLYNDLKNIFGSSKINLAKAGQKNKPITIANIQSLASLPSDFFSDKDFLIIDEFHHQSSQSYTDANFTLFNNIYYRLALTATNYRNRKEEDLFLRSFSSKILKQLTPEEAINSKYIAIPKFTCVQFEHTKEEIIQASEEMEKCRNKMAKYHKLRVNLVNESKTFNFILETVVRANVLADKRTVVLFDQVTQLERFESEIPDLSPQKITGLTQGNYKVLEEFNKCKIPLLLASPVAGEGVNLKPVDCLIITAPDRSKPLFMQRVGRGLRNFENKEICDIIFFDCTSNLTLSSQAKKKIEYCREEFGKYGDVRVIKCKN